MGPNKAATNVLDGAVASSEVQGPLPSSFKLLTELILVVMGVRSHFLVSYSLTALAPRGTCPEALDNRMSVFFQGRRSASPHCSPPDCHGDGVPKQNPQHNHF